MGRKLADASKHCLSTSPEQSQALGPRESPYNNTGPHLLRANRELENSQQASPCLKGRCLCSPSWLHRGGSLGTFYPGKHSPPIPAAYFNTQLHTPGCPHVSCLYTQLGPFSPGSLQEGQCMKSMEAGADGDPPIPGPA